MPLRRAEINSTIHGFRSSFRDWCSEATNTPREVAEAALAHAVEGVEGAYARTDHYERRVTLMERWAANRRMRSAMGAPRLTREQPRRKVRQGD